MSNTVRRLKADEKKIIMAYALTKLQSNRLNKELDKMKQNVVDVFERTKQNLVIVQDDNGNSRSGVEMKELENFLWWTSPLIFIYILLLFDVISLGSVFNMF